MTFQDPESISIIVPVYNAGAGWSRVLDALCALQPAPLECIIVDDGSTDGSQTTAFARGFTILPTPNPNSGPAVARNLGAARAQGHILFFLDADVVVYPDAVKRVTVAMSDSSVSAIFGSYDDAPPDPSLVSQYKNLQHHFVHQTSNPEASTFWAGCGAIRRELFLALGGFSTQYTRPSIEDIELGTRVRQAGGRIRLVRDLQVKHLKHWTLRSWLLTDISDRALPWARLITRQAEMPADLNLQAAHRVSAFLCWLLLLALIGVLFSPLFLLAVLAFAGALVALNISFYRFLMKKRGVLFLLGAIPLHWLYYLYSSAAFAYVLLTNARYARHRPDALTRAPNHHA